MKSIKVLMDYNNYFYIAHTHVFINFTKANLTFINSLPLNTVKKIHVFITNHESINHHLGELINRYGNKGNRNYVRIIIHLSRGVESLVPLFKDFFKSHFNKFIWFVDKQDVHFFDDENHTYRAMIQYRGKFLRVKFGGNGFKSIPVKFKEYPYLATPSADREGSSGIFKTFEQRVRPELFKDELIAEFKKQTPEGILKSFKDDDDIWGFIMNNAEITTREE